MTEHDPSLSGRVCYSRGCRRVECVEANAQYQRKYRNSPSGIAQQRRHEMKVQQERAQKWRNQAAMSVD